MMTVVLPYVSTPARYGNSNFFQIFCFLLIVSIDTATSFLLTSKRTYMSKNLMLPLGKTPPERLQELLDAEMDGIRQSDSPILLPCCYDGLTARLVASAGFEATFMSGFGVSAVAGFPDTQLLSYSEMLSAAQTVSEGLAAFKEPIPCIADGDTGYGNCINTKRTVAGYARAGMAGIMIEDQVAPKRCGHVSGKTIVPFDEAVTRVQAACDARDEYCEQFGAGTAPLILARTDAIATDGFDAGIERCLAFLEAGADMTFLEAPESVEQMQEYCSTVPGPKLANMLEHGTTPVLPPTELKAIGYTMAAYPLTLLAASIRTMEESLRRIKEGESTNDLICNFDHTKKAVGFKEYAAEEDRYRTDVEIDR